MKKSWIVRMTATVTKEVVTGPCTEEQARNSPFDHVIDEREIDQSDYEVNSVTPNE